MSGPARYQRSLIACVECRTLKIRCKGNEDQVSSCERCGKLGLFCDYTRKKRGRKVGQSVTPVQHDPIPFVSVSVGPALTPARIPQSLDVTSYLDPSKAAQEDVLMARQEDDPRMMSQAEAEHLLQMYFEHLHPVVALLDPQLHTLSYLRQTSSILLTSVLSSTAKFFHRRLRPLLLSHAQVILNRSLAIGECNTAIIQALVLLSGWKEPTDRSSWIKLGVAIRLGFQLGLHRPRTVPLPQDERQARVWADSERAWIVLSCTDRSYADIFSLPTAMRPEHVGDTMQWAGETARFHSGDMRHACSMASSSAYLLWIQFGSTKEDIPVVSRLAVLRSIYDQIDLHMQQWFPSDPSNGLFSANEQRILKWFDLNHLIKIRCRMLKLCDTHEKHEMRRSLLQNVDAFASQTEILGQGGQLAYLLDTSATHISKIGIMLQELFVDFDDSEQRQAAAILQRICRCCDAVATGDPQACCAYVARFIHRVLRTIAVDTQTRQGTPVPGEVPTGDMSWLGDIEEFIRASEPSLMPMPWDQTLDDQFWANMNWFTDD